MPTLTTNHYLAVAGLLLGASGHFTWQWLNARPVETQIQQVVVTETPVLARAQTPLFYDLKPLPEMQTITTAETQAKPHSASAHYQKKHAKKVIEASSTIDTEAEPFLDEAMLQELVQEGLQQLNNPETIKEPVRTQTPNIYELPYELQARVPAFVYNSHTYSSEADKRFVILSQKLFHEGDEIVAGLEITRIENQNLVLTMGNYTFAVAAMEDWNGV